MKRTLLVLLSLLLLTVGMSFAQQDAQQPAAAQPSAQQPADQQPSAQQPSAQQTDVGKPTDTDQQLFKGCVSGTKDNYTLTDESGKTYRLHSDKDINEHVGDMVEIRGTLKPEGADRPDSQQASAGAQAQREIDVADIKTVSKGCSDSQKQ